MPFASSLLSSPGDSTSTALQLQLIATTYPSYYIYTRFQGIPHREEKAMFERFTETARRAVFFSRYMASQAGSHEIDTEHMLLGLLVADMGLARRFR